jgi:hypothetical protein
MKIMTGNIYHFFLPHPTSDAKNSDKNHPHPAIYETKRLNNRRP